MLDRLDWQLGLQHLQCVEAMFAAANACIAAVDGIVVFLASVSEIDRLADDVVVCLGFVQDVVVVAL